MAKPVENSVRGPIIVSRHGQPVLDRTAGPRLNWRDYKDWWARYGDSPLRDDQFAPEVLKALVADADVVLSSTLPRAIQTAERAAPGHAITQDAIFVEANLPPPLIPGVKFLPKTWNVLARSAWVFGHTLDGESASQARVRAAGAAGLLHEASEEGKVYLAAHGWFNRMLRGELRKLGWKCVHNGGDSYWAHRIYEYRPR